MPERPVPSVSWRVAVGATVVLGLALWTAAYAPPPTVAVADADVATWLHEHAQPQATAAMRTVSWLGGPLALISVTALAVLLLLLRRRRGDALLVATAFVGAGILNALLKMLFARERPFFADPLVRDGGFSFPSGHAMISIAVYGALAVVLARTFRSDRARVAVWMGAGGLAAAIGFTRLYLGAHYLTDVIVGLSCGAVWLALCALAVGLRRRMAAATAPA